MEPQFEPIRYHSLDHAKRVIVIAGPTASGKSGLALEWAKALDSELVNADASQVYDGLQILTNRPTENELNSVPHHLFGYLPPTEVCSVARWRDDAKKVIEEVWQCEKVPIVVGGTGLYLEALIKGLSDIPQIPENVRQQMRDQMAEVGPEVLYQQLSLIDPVSAARIKPQDRQRITRALEVYHATGKSLSQWQDDNPPTGAIRADIYGFALIPDREVLYHQINQRFEKMIKAGALAEVESLLARKLDPALPIMKSLGLAELAAYLRGEVSQEEAIVQAQQLTRHYAKRQTTWIRHRLTDFRKITNKRDSLKYLESLRRVF